MDTDTRNRLLASGEWRDALLAEAQTWKWTPYQHRGRVKGVGVDCGGLIYELYNPWFGPFKPFPNDYPPDWAAHKEGNELYLDFIRPYVEEVKKVPPAGFTLFHYGRNFSHAAIWTGRRYLHAFGRTNAGCVKEDMPAFFSNKGGKLREAKHFDVSKQWLSRFLSPSLG